MSARHGRLARVLMGPEDMTTPRPAPPADNVPLSRGDRWAVGLLTAVLLTVAAVAAVYGVIAEVPWGIVLGALALTLATWWVAFTAICAGAEQDARRARVRALLDDVHRDLDRS